MALKTVHLLSLWGLTLFVHGGTSFCNVTCSTDYSVTVNCSCSAPLTTYSVIVEVSCSDGYGLYVNSSCEVKPPQSWCIMYPEDLEDVTSIGTMCTATVTQQDSRGVVKGMESSVWELSHVVKALPPLDVHVTNSGRFYNITWDHNDRENSLTYRVRVRESRKSSEDAALVYLVEGKHKLLEHMKLRPHVNYTVDVAAKMCPENLYLGPWSEWSSSAEWTTTGSSAVEFKGMNKTWLFSLLSIVAVLGVVVYSQKTYLQKKLHLITYIPTPQEFFKPLYHNYEGNFKDWVKPVFSENDFLSINSDVNVQRKSEKQPDVLQWKNEKRSYSEDVIKQGGHHFLHMMQPHNNPLLFVQAAGSSQSSGHSSGHISIHTVTLSGEGEFEEEVRSRNSENNLRSYRDGESFASFEDDNRELAGYNLEELRLSRLDGHSGMLSQLDNQISNDISSENSNFEPHAMIHEPERLSLDSFVSLEQSDGYPHVDLDTVDSGFGECSSPGASDSNMAGQMDLFQEHKNSNSNYVKQWMICSTIQEDSNNTEQAS
ncbi:interleukin-21 receptor [Labrus bergylta]|uniref:interleukin-21 receptor n=1 Tax=Labrus bergylta TaxID=56723 RepID=UPI003313F38D